ncbi:hypothetical protein AXG93_4012s1260 [Marchantia polymorpha subsp. ruderalis]|uniref:HAT C-terminal dimerisation domain-containing protein n=1 Tax=Marchantia polymorpha subsp. ruderalis TaxID=1480154 RepID=A0A176VML9_MARPO|nr:hypothetical protein AXG93_4012s1260 [Marchantia polymorpha subsp. ruderalis]
MEANAERRKQRPVAKVEGRMATVSGSPRSFDRRERGDCVRRQVSDREDWVPAAQFRVACGLERRGTHGEGFQSLLQTVLDIGVASKNPIRIKDLLSDEVTVKRAAVKTYQTIRQVLIAELQAHFQDKMYAGCTLDIWTEPLTSIAYMSVTMHYIDVDFKHNARTLQVDQFPEVSHTAVAILKTFKQCIIPFTGEFDSMNGPVKEQIMITTDHASNNCGEDGLPSEFQWNGCADHSISTCVSFVLDKRTSIVNGKKSKPYYQFYANAPAVFDMLDNCKALVTYVKRVGLNKQLTPKLKQAVATRWVGILIMTNSIDCEFESHQETLTLRHQEQKMDVIDRSLLHELVLFLNLFQIATKELEAFKNPTLHMVTHWGKVLLEHYDIVDEEHVVKDKDGVKVTLPPDSKDLVNIKDLIKDQILEKFMLTALHVAATYLDPRQKPIISELEIEDELQPEAIAIIKSTMVQNSPPTLTIDDKRPVLPTACNRHPRKRKRAAIPVVFPRRCINDFSSNDDDDDQDDIDSVPNTATLEILVIAELQAYEAFTLSKSEKRMMKETDEGTSGTGILLWWKSKASTWLILARAARSILAVPASSAMLENNFSDSGSTVSKKRNQLKPSTVNILMFLRSNIDLTK